jgi:N-acetylmuramoyl-L-alanine amidase
VHRRLLRAFLILVAGIGVWPQVGRSQESFKLDLEGRTIEIPIRRLGGIGYIRLVDLARGFGGSVEWLDPGERVAANFLGERVVFRRDIPFVEAKGSLHQIPQAPRFQGGELLVPFSFIQQGLPAIFPERFDFQSGSTSLREGPPGGSVARIEYLVAPGLTTLRFFFVGSHAPRFETDNSLPHTLVLRLEGAGVGGLAPNAVSDVGLVDSLHVERDPQGAERLVFFLDDQAFLYQVARLAEPAGFELTVYSPASGVDDATVLARGVPRPPAGLPPPPRRSVGDVDSPAAERSSGTAAVAGVAGSAGTDGEVVESATRAPAGGAPVVETPLPASPRLRKPRAGVRTVVIDAGHGGRDVGAIGPSGVREKDVTLQIARALQAELEHRSDLRVILTRDSDMFVPLTARTRMANEAGADLFISIHCNAARSRSGQGFETYFLSEAKTEDERRVARMENASLRFENPDIDPQQLGELNFILWDLAQNEYLRESSDLAELVQRGLGDELDLDDRGVKQAGFWVLNGAYMPAILIETAFISNPSEERLLASHKFQSRLVDGIADSVLDYVAAYDRKLALDEETGA